MHNPIAEDFSKRGPIRCPAVSFLMPAGELQALRPSTPECVPIITCHQHLLTSDLQSPAGAPRSAARICHHTTAAWTSSNPLAQPCGCSMPCFFEHGGSSLQSTKSAMLWELNDGRQGFLRVGRKRRTTEMPSRDLAAGDALLEPRPLNNGQFAGCPAFELAAAFSLADRLGCMLKSCSGRCKRPGSLFWPKQTRCRRHT